jgi:excisionase family DNA binding protein
MPISITPTNRIIYDRKNAAFQLSISVRTLDYLVANHKIPFRRQGRKVMFLHNDLVKYANTNHFDSCNS